MRLSKQTFVKEFDIREVKGIKDKETKLVLRLLLEERFAIDRMSLAVDKNEVLCR